MTVQTIDELRALYPEPKERVLKKELTGLEQHASRFIELSPLCIVATISKAGTMDNSPRGGDRGFVKIINPNRIIVPDSKGNNRLDSLCNIVESGTVGLLFLIPGVNEALRINGKATVDTDADILKNFDHFQNKPKTFIDVQVEEVFLHCAKALMRSQCWDASAQLERSELPTIGEMIKDMSGIAGPVETQAEMLKRYEKEL